MTPPPPPQHLSPSELGTKEYWDTTYRQDLTTHSQDPSYTGAAWFDDSSASQKTLSYLLSLSPPLSTTTTSFLDLGTGNGEMLFLLRSEGRFIGRMLGVDYSAPSVEWAKRIAASKGYRSEDVAFAEWDIMVNTGDWVWGQFDVVLDKGTFDAVSLNAETDADGRRVCEGYRAKVVPMMKKGGRFLVTSCNWTEDELRKWFEGKDAVGDGLEWEGRVDYPSFSFGGVTGQSVSGMCFRRPS
ncbi:MAG: hypothetical protein Q9219_003896 [cf. Caloplaca sp. 3 TL-2023]